MRSTLVKALGRTMSQVRLGKFRLEKLLYNPKSCHTDNTFRHVLCRIFLEVRISKKIVPR